jgi:P27 family predicted phage terminase small subunit
VAQIPPPTQLPKTQQVLALWRTILSEVARHELRAGDLPLIEALCVAKYRHHAAGNYIRKHGMVVQTPFGPAKNPMLKEERDQAALYDKIAQRLGLSPESRVRLDLMQVAGATLLSSLKKTMQELVDGTVGDDEDVVDGDAVEEP